MENQSNNHVLERLEKLEKEGFKDQVMFRDSKLINLTSKQRYNSDQIISCREYRFEGMSNPSDLSLLFALEFDDKSKGTLTAAYGPKGDVELYEFMEKIDPSRINKDKR